jgi:modification methylase
MPDRPTGPRSRSHPPRKQPPIPPLSVWPTGQRDLITQLREAGYVPGTETDTDQISPAIAAHAITAYTHPGELVLDPDCGAGTVLVEALRADRHALGLTAQSQWWTLARANITATKRDGAGRDGSVLDARPRLLATIRAAGLVGRVGLILTTLRTQPNTARPDNLNVAFDDLAATVRYCEPLLRAGGRVVVTAHPCRQPDGSLVDTTTRLTDAARSAGLVPVERCIALTGALRGGRIIARASLVERRAATRAHTAGIPIALIAHHEVIVFQRLHDVELATADASTPWPTNTSTITPPTANGAEYHCRRPAA